MYFQIRTDGIYRGATEKGPWKLETYGNWQAGNFILHVKAEGSDEDLKSLGDSFVEALDSAGGSNLVVIATTPGVSATFLELPTKKEDMTKVLKLVDDI